MTKQDIFDNACDTGDLLLVKKLIRDPKVDPTLTDSYGLRWAARNGHIDIVTLLLEDGRADPDAWESYALCWAVHYGHSKIVKMLLKCDQVDKNELKGTDYEYLLKRKHNE